MATGDETGDPDATLSTPSKATTAPYSPAFKFVAAMQEQAKRYVALAPRPNILDETATSTELPDQHVKVMRDLLPKTLPRLRRQGPILLQPAPRELAGSFDSEASDLVQVTYSKSTDSTEISEPLTAFVIAYSDGKIDICLDLANVEPRFEAQVCHINTSDGKSKTDNNLFRGLANLRVS